MPKRKTRVPRRAPSNTRAKCQKPPPGLNEALLAIKALDASPRSRFERLLEGPANARQGADFEQLILELLVNSGFRVRRSPQLASPRQTDLFAEKNRADYLIEAKCQGKPVGSDAIDALRSRLNRTAPDVVGVFFSIHGYSQPALDEIRNVRRQEVIPFDGAELRRVLSGSCNVETLLERKRRELRINAQVWFYPADMETIPPRGVELPAPEERLVGQSSPTWRCRSSGHEELVFARSIPDPGWGAGGGSGVALRIDFDLTCTDDLQRILEVIHEYGGLSGDGSYAIAQTGVIWHGVGVRQFLKDIAGINDRYRELPQSANLHHSEEIAYFDSYGAGYLLLECRQRATRSPPCLDSGQLEIRLPGIPVDAEPIEKLCVEVGSRAAYFVPESGAYRQCARTNSPVKAVGQINKTRERWKTADDGATCGIIVRNPLFNKDTSQLNEPGQYGMNALGSSEHLLCDLRQWHGPNDAVRQYRLRAIETLQVGEWTVVHPVCEWDEVVTPEGHKIGAPWPKSGKGAKRRRA